MADHGLDYQPEERLIAKINDLQQQLGELRTLQLQGSNAINISVSSNYSADAIGLLNNQVALFRYSYDPGIAQILFTTFHFTLYQGTATTGNEINTTYAAYYDWHWWRDWGDSNNQNVKDYVWVRNKTGSTQDVLMRGNWRYIVNNGTGGIS